MRRVAVDRPIAKQHKFGCQGTQDGVMNQMPDMPNQTQGAVVAIRKMGIVIQKPKIVVGRKVLHDEGAA